MDKKEVPIEEQQLAHLIGIRRSTGAIAVFLLVGAAWYVAWSASVILVFALLWFDYSGWAGFFSLVSLALLVTGVIQTLKKAWAEFNNSYRW